MRTVLSMSCRAVHTHLLRRSSFSVTADVIPGRGKRMMEQSDRFQRLISWEDGWGLPVHLFTNSILRSTHLQAIKNLFSTSVHVLSSLQLQLPVPRGLAHVSHTCPSLPSCKFAAHLAHLYLLLKSNYLDLPAAIFLGCQKIADGSRAPQVVNK
jgi:hypothetical protein